jgi:hypothetical protein
MARIQAVVVCLLFGLLAGCVESPSEPEGAVLGTFAAGPVRLVATTKWVTLDVFCDVVFARTPLIPRPSDGRFLLPMTGAVGGTSPAAGSLTLRGTVSDPTITFDVVTVTPDTTHTARYTVTRDAPVQGVPCLDRTT